MHERELDLSNTADVPACNLVLSPDAEVGACRPLDEECECVACKTYTRAFLHNLVAKGLPFAAHLMSMHNIAYTQALTKRIREAIIEQRFPEFAHGFVRQHYAKVRGPGPRHQADVCPGAQALVTFRAHAAAGIDSAPTA